MPELTLCNELLHGEGLSLAEQARVAAALGYMGLELAPATLGQHPHLLGAEERAEIRATIEAQGLRVTGLHWLLSGYPELSITDPARRAETTGVLIALVDLCADLGGRVMVHGSPGQRRLMPGQSLEEAHHDLAAFFAPVARACEARGITYCIEPLAPRETDLITTVAEGVALSRAVGSPAFRTMIDISAAGLTEPPVPALIARWVPTGWIGHIHANDTNRGAPGTGRDDFAAIMAALGRAGWEGPIGVEPFVTCVDARVTAAIAAATLRAHALHI